MCFELCQMGNINEVPPNADVPSNKNMDIKDAKVIIIKTSSHEKKHHTVVSACSASGEKLPSLLIFQRKMMPNDKIPHSTFMPKDGWMKMELSYSYSKYSQSNQVASWKTQHF